MPEFTEAELNFSTINPSIGNLLSQDKRFYYTTLDSISLLESWKHIGQGPFLVKTVFPYGAVEISDPQNVDKFMVNG